MSKLFDLNIEQVLENWEVEHAIREIIANALDEQILTNTKQVDIYKSNNYWHIRDYGRGLQYSHFTQNENTEKLQSPNLIGKFGVGLKDALAVFYRKHVGVEINSAYAHITLTMAPKEGFDIKTLHAVFSEPLDPSFKGTDFILSNVSDIDIAKAKSMFLCYNKSLVLLEKTKYGDVYKCFKSPATIYINGVQVATEDNFMFCYNVTNISTKIKKALNRERTNVGRTAYSDSIKNILRQCKSKEVLLPLVDDLSNVMSGTNKDESSWVDIASQAAQTLNDDESVVFMTAMQRANLTNQQVEILEQSGKKLVLVTDSVYNKIQTSVPTFDTVYSEYNDSFTYNFVPVSMLSHDEKEVFSLTHNIISFLKSSGYRTDIKIKISETVFVSTDGSISNGVYDRSENAIIILRQALSDKYTFCSTLLHEFAHYQHGYSDLTRDFENELTTMLGIAFLQLLKNDSKPKFLRRLFK